MALAELSRDEYAADMSGYLHERAAAAAAFGCRGPVRYDAKGELHPDILQDFETHGFYIFERVVDALEVAELGEAVEEPYGHLLRRVVVRERLWGAAECVARELVE